jgi:cephalosporin hydroxylase
MTKNLLRFLLQEIKTLRRILRRRMLLSRSRERSLVDQFHQLYFASAAHDLTWGKTSWLGTKTMKCPLDLWVYQEILYETRPDLIVETGTFMGGSALFLATVCDQIDCGRIVTIDIEERAGRPAHPRIEYLLGSSTAPEIVAAVRTRAAGGQVMVVLDACHRRDHVIEELELYGPLVSMGCYLVVEDTNVNGHPVVPEYGPGPMEAVEEFLRRNEDFKSDRSKEKFLLTFNPRGYLLRIGSSARGESA